MWTVHTTVLTDTVHQFTIHEDDTLLTYSDVIRYWWQSPEFRTFYCSMLENSPFTAYFWENPPVTVASLRQPYEFVLVDSPQLAAVHADPKPFQERFRTDAVVIAFENLGRDAELIVPCPIAEHDMYAHLAAFVRRGPEDQKQAMFSSLANSLNQRMNTRPTWVSTSGLGVYWLHIRLDTRPKYYSHLPYRQA